ncbi:unnamed protein product, partial [Bemisia tabaci]
LYTMSSASRSYRGVLCLSIAAVLSSGVLLTEAAEPYYGKFIGSLRTQHHGVTGDVYAVDSRNLHIRNFNYDGEGPAAYFYAGNSKAPSSSGFQLRDEKGKSVPLRKYRNEHVTVTLPDGKTLNNIKWFSVWCDEFAVNFGDVKIPKNFEYPKPQKIGQLNGIHGVSSDNVIIVDAQTLLIQSFSYDGEAPDAKFWVGVGPTPSPQGIRVPDENGKETPLKRYNRKHIVLTLPKDLTVFDIGHFGVWCEAFTVDFGHVEIPQGNLNVPPSLKMLGVSPQSKLNCEVLHDDLAFEVRWAVAGDSIVLQLVAKLEDGEYMSFGLSGDDKKNKMIGGDVVVAWINHETLSGFAVDYYLDDKSQCSGPRGSCPDDKLQEGAESVRLLNAALVNGYSIVTYQRQLKAHDTYDKSISTNGSQAVIWAIGPLNTRQEVSYHSIFSKGDILLDFGRSPKWNCPIPDSDVDMSGEKMSESSHTTAPSRIQQETTKYSETVPTEPLRSQGTTAKPQATPAPAPKGEVWDIPPIECNEPEDGVFYAQLGPTGGKRGYPAITGHVGWGISWYINGLLIPVVNVVRGKTYTFVVEGGLDANTPAKYHPFYITDDPVGGYHYKTPEERAKVKIFAGVAKNQNGEIEPTGIGRSCNWTPDQNGPTADEFVSFGAYQRTLSLVCDHGEPGIVQWTPDENTPDTVYYQCYTHRYLGWKINVLDECDKESPAAAASEQVTSKVAFDGEENMKAGNDLHADEEDGDPIESHASYQVSVKVKPDQVGGTGDNEFVDKTSSKEFEENLSLVPTHAKDNLVKDEKNEIVPPPQSSYSATGFQYFDNGNNYGQASTIYGKQTAESVNSPQNYENTQNEYTSAPASSTSTTASGYNGDYQGNNTNNQWNVYNGDIDYGSDSQSNGDSFKVNVGSSQGVDYTSNNWNVHYGFGSGYGGSSDSQNNSNNYNSGNYNNGNVNYNSNSNANNNYNGNSNANNNYNGNSNANNNYNGNSNANNNFNNNYDGNTATSSSTQSNNYESKPVESTQSTNTNVDSANAYKNTQNNYAPSSNDNVSSASGSGSYTTIKEQPKRPEYIRPDSQSEESIDVPNYYNKNNNNVHYANPQSQSSGNQVHSSPSSSPAKPQNQGPHAPSNAYAHVTFTTDHKLEDHKKGQEYNGGNIRGGAYIPNGPRPNIPFKGAYVLNPNQRPNRPPSYPPSMGRPQYQKRPSYINGQNQQRLSNRPPMGVIAAAQNHPRPVIVKKPIYRVPQQQRPTNYGQPGTRPPHVKSQPPKIIPVSFPAVKYNPRTTPNVQAVTEKIKNIPLGKPTNAVPPVVKPIIPSINPQHFQKEPHGNTKLNLAVNTGFNPGSVVIESGFRPIVQNQDQQVPEKDRAQERMAEGLGDFIDDNESDQGNKYLKEDGNIGTIQLPEESRPSPNKSTDNQTKASEEEKKNPFEGQNPVSFEPMFIPSPLDSITQQKYSYKKPTEMVAFQKKPYLRKPIRQSMVVVRPQPMMKRVPVIKVPIFYEKDVAPPVQPLPHVHVHEEPEDEMEPEEEEDEDEDEEMVEPAERLDTYYLPPSGPIYGVPKNGQVIVPGASNGLITTIVSYDGKPVRNVQVAPAPAKRMPGNLMLKVPILGTSDNQMTLPKIYAVQLGNQAPQILPQPVEPQALALAAESNQYEVEENSKEDTKKDLDGDE